MKYKVIALAVSGALLAACGSDNDNYVEPTGSSTSLQAFDGAVRFLDAYMNCGNGFDFIGETGGNGTINIGEGNYPLFDEDPSQCTFEFGENLHPSGGGSTTPPIDESNSKELPTIKYVVPGSLIQADKPIVGSPYTTLISQAIDEDDSGLTVAQIIDQVFAASLPSGTTLTDEQKALLLSDPQAALDTMDETTSTNVLASTMILSDALVGAEAQGGKSVAELSNVTQTLATSLAANDNFPTNSSGEPTFVDYSEDLEDPTNFQSIVDNDPDPEADLPPSSAVPDGEDPLQDGEKIEDDLPPTDIPPVEEELPPPTGGTGGTAG
ncbi:hypothetical protein [Vibrio breoganii]|uniref:hypothetical protein n=1 Tax=Vibrio breoganii TaxID=553239 RepID=UPI000C85B5FF|nr:hypothetical protein [Vibrio breoganii]PMM87727.1 hypothetical protein BCT44_04070 [Vibrio breoganii]